MEGARAAGNARPHALPAHRRPALPGALPPYGFFWFQLNIIRRASRKRSCRARSPRCWSGMAGKTRCRLDQRTFEAEVLPSFTGAALVRRQGFALDLGQGLRRRAGGIQRRAHCVRDRESTGRHGVAAIPAADDRLVALHRHRQEPGERPCRRPARRQRRHPNPCNGETNFISVLLSKIKAAKPPVLTGKNSIPPTSAFVDDTPPEFKSITPYREQSKPV